MNKISHNYSIDLMRGLAALSVAFFHYGSSGNYLSAGSWLREVSSYGHWGVQVFFIISGFVIPLSMYKTSYSWGGIKNFLLKRVIRIEPPYIAMIIAGPLIWYLSTLSRSYSGPSFHLDLFQFFSHFGYLTEFLSYEWINPVFWTLSIEFQFYLLMALIFPWLLNSGNKFIISLLILAGCITGERYILFTNLLFFNLGILIFLFQNKKLEKNWLILFSGVIFGVLAMQFDVFVLLLSLLSYLAILFTNFKSGVGSFLGKISYSFYLIHVPIGARVVHILERYVQTESLKVLVISGGVLVSVGVAYVFYLLIEKPALILSRKIPFTGKKEAEKGGLNQEKLTKLEV